MKFTFVFFLFLTSLTKSLCQQNNFKSISYREGLNTYNIIKTVEDRFGFIWIATQDGLYRFDGKGFDLLKKNNSPNDGICNNYIFDIIYDGCNLIYVASFEGGIDVIDINSLGIKHLLCIEKGNFKGLPNGWIRKILLDKNNQIWILGEGYFAKYDLKNEKISFPFENQYKTLDFKVDCISMYNSDILLVGCNNFGLFFIDTKTEKVITNTKVISSKKVNNSLKFKDIVVFKDTSYIIMENTIVEGQLIKNSWVPQHDIYTTSAKTGMIAHFAKDSKYGLWIATADGLKRKIPGKDFVENIPIYNELKEDEQQTIRGLFFDNHDNLWISTTKELLFLSGKENGITAYKGNDNVRMPHLYSIIPKDSVNIFTTGTDGFYCTNTFLNKTQKIKNSNSLGVVHYMEIVKPGLYLVSSDKGMFLYNERVNTLSKKACVEMFPEWEPFQNNYFNNSLIYKNKEYWVSEEDEGMFIWDKSKHIVTKVKANTSLNKGLQENLIHNIKKDRDGFAWILSNNTIAKYDMEADTVVELFKYHSKSKQLNSGIYFDMYDDGSNLWFATYGGGLNILNKKSRRWGYFTEADGLSNNNVYSILPEGNNFIWVSTNNGLSRINLHTKESMNFFTEDGLQSNSFDEKGSLLHNNKLYFAGIDGFSEINLSKLNQQVNTRDLIVNKIEYYTGKKKVVDNHLNIQTKDFPSTTSAISICLSIPDFRNQTKYRIFYRIKNQQSFFLPVDNTNKIQLIGLSYGKYVLEFKYYDASGKETFVINNLALFISPKWYQTWLFKIAVALAIVALLYLLYAFRIRQLKKVFSIRQKISSDLHDDIGSTLSSINMYSQIAQLQPNQPGYADTIQENTQEVLDKLDDIVWATSPKNDQVHNLVERIDAFARPLLQAHNIRFVFNVGENMANQKISTATRQNTFLICKEAINNAAKYARCNTCTVTMNVKNKCIHCTITDDGIGFDTTLPTERNGLLNMQLRAKAVKGKFELVSSPGKGTVIKMQLPL